MSEQSRTVSLRQLTRGGRPAPEYGEVSPAKALRLALAKAGQSVLGQVVDGSGIEELRVSLDKLAEVLPMGGLSVMLHGPSEARGLLCLDRTMVATITEGLTTGKIAETAVAERAPTQIDALLCQRFLVTLLTVFAARLVGHSAAEWATGFVPEDPVDDLRRLPILMDDELYRVLSVSTDFAGGRRTGQMTLVLPVDGRMNTAQKPEEIADLDAATDDWTKAMEQALLPAEVELEAVLYRIVLPLSKVSALEPGMSIPIPRRAVAEVVLEDGNAERVCIVRLGQSQGFRAIRVEQAPLRNDLSPLTNLDGPAGGTPQAPLSLADAMAQAPGLAGKIAPPSEHGLNDADPNAGMPPIDEAPASGEDFGASDLDSLPMTDLDDLPMSIE